MKRGLGGTMKPEVKQRIQRAGGLASPTSFKNNPELAKEMAQKPRKRYLPGMPTWMWRELEKQDELKGTKE